MKHELIGFNNSWDISSPPKSYIVAIVYLQIFHPPCNPMILNTWTKEVKGEMSAPVSLEYIVTLLEETSRNHLLQRIAFKHPRQMNIYVVLKDF